MKVKTLIRFREKDNYAIVHEVGSEFECTQERGNYLAKLGFVERLAEAKPEEPAETAEPVAEKTEKAPKSKKKKTMPFDGEGEAQTESAE